MAQPCAEQAPGSPPSTQWACDSIVGSLGERTMEANSHAGPKLRAITVNRTGTGTHSLTRNKDSKIGPGQESQKVGPGFVRRLAKGTPEQLGCPLQNRSWALGERHS